MSNLCYKDGRWDYLWICSFFLKVLFEIKDRLGGFSNVNLFKGVFFILKLVNEYF